MYIFPFIFSSVVRRTVVSIEAASLANLAVLVLQWAFVVCELHVRALLADDNPWADDVLSANRRHRSRNRFADYSRRKPQAVPKQRWRTEQQSFVFSSSPSFTSFRMFFLFFFLFLPQLPSSFYTQATLMFRRNFLNVSWKRSCGEITQSVCLYFFTAPLPWWKYLWNAFLILSFYFMCETHQGNSVYHFRYISSFCK